MLLKLAFFVVALQLPLGTLAASSLPGTSAYVAPYGFPSTAFSSYYFLPAEPTAEPQPALFDPVLNETFPQNLTDPSNIPTVDTDPVYYPTPTTSLSAAEATAFLNAVVQNVSSIIAAAATGSASNCTVCKNVLAAAKPAALTVPSLVPSAMVSLCESLKFSSNKTCSANYQAGSFGQIWTQILAFADVEGEDGQYICNSLGGSTWCPAPKTLPLDTTNLFPKPKPSTYTIPKPNGNRVKVLHMSDFHLDPRYDVGAEANCSSGLCCRSNANPTTGVITEPAPYYGAFACDSPYGLGLAALQAIGPLTGTNSSCPLAWTVYTGDLVSHDSQNQLSRAYAEYTEVSLYGLFKQYLTGPVYLALGNHDSNPEAIDAPHSLPGPLGEQQSWNYDHVAGLWEIEGWINKKQAKTVRTHYGAYSIKNKYGLKIITLNTDFWYKSNFLNFINTTNPDNSGILKFLINELQEAEDAGERVWVMGHVLTGWDGTNPIPNPTDLFYQIIDRYSPHVIANVFFGHTHEDEFMIYYANNGTVMNSSTALTTGWIGPSITPLTNLNSGFRLYEVDTGDFNIYEAYTFYSDVHSYPNLTSTGPTYQYEYSTRETYGSQADWPTDAPLNATFWHTVTEAMEKNRTLVSVHNTFQGKLSTKSPNCTSDACTAAKICYMRSGSVPIALRCPPGFGSVQSPFTGNNTA